jgi:protein ImuA
LALGGVSELIPDVFMDEPASITFALACAARALHQRAGDLVVVEDGAHARLWGHLYAPGLQGMGIDPARVLMIAPETARAFHGCLEECARTTGLAAVLGLAGPKAGFALGAARRVQLAAEQGQSLVLLVQSLRTPHFAPACARLRIASAPSQGQTFVGTALPAPGRPAWTAHLDRARSGAPPQTFGLEYDDATHCLYQPATLADRPLVAQRLWG